MSVRDYPTEGQITEASRLHRARTMEQNHINNFEAMRAKATRLIAGNPKAAGIVREIDATLERLQLRAEGASRLVGGQGGEVAFLKLEVDQGQEAYPAVGKQLIHKDLEVQAQALVHGLSERESQVADRYRQFCLELSNWARDAVFHNRALECNELEQALKNVYSTMFKRAGGTELAIITQLSSMLVVPDID